MSVTLNTRSASMSGCTHVMENILQSDNVTRALKEDGIDDRFGLLSLTDTNINKLTYLYPDPSNPVQYSLKKGEVGLIRAFIHFVHYCHETNNPINDQWLSLTQDEFDQFRTNHPG
jgi:hypothetical protein